jgi:hypothetical protein
MKAYGNSSLFPVLCGLLVLVSGGLHAVDVTTTDGLVYPNASMRRAGAMVMIKVTIPGGTSMVEVGLQPARIAKINFPEPPELAKAVAAAAKGNANEVLNLTSAYVLKEGDYKDLPGSWWPEMARLRLLALASVSKDTECAELARQIGALQIPWAESLARGGTLFAPLSTSDTEAVVVGAKSLPRLGGDQGSALAQLALARALLIKKDHAGAIRAFLTVKVFYPSVALLQPAALMGAASTYLALKDETRAVQSFNEIVSAWPDSPQAAEEKKKSEGQRKP